MLHPHEVDLEEGFDEPEMIEQPIGAAPRREILIAILQVAAALLAIVPFFWPWAGNHRIYAIVVVVIVFGWIAKPRLQAWIKRNANRRRDGQFIAANDARLREFVQQFAEFIADNNARSLVYIVRTACSQNMTAVEQILTGDYIGHWFFSYREQLAFPAQAIAQFLARCREFTNIVQQFNSHYALRAQRLFTAPAAPLSEHTLDELEGFREEYNAFLRSLEPWAKGIAGYLQSLGVTDTPSQWRLAPTTYFERPKSFKKSQPVTK
jgi:hypothetical protein